MLALMHSSKQKHHQLFVENIDSGRPSSEGEAGLTASSLDIFSAVDIDNTLSCYAKPTFPDFLVP